MSLEPQSDVFLMLGFVFLAVGIGGNAAFIGLGSACIAIGLTRRMRT